MNYLCNQCIFIEKMAFERVYFNVFGYTQQDMLKFASFLSIL